MIQHRKRLPRKRILVPLLSVSLMLIAVLGVLAATPPNIDTFEVPQATLSATGVGSSAQGFVNDPSSSNPSILGGQREAHLLVTQGGGQVSVSFPGTYMQINTPTDTVATTTLTYDGRSNSDPDPANVNPVGLCSGGLARVALT